MNEPFEDIRFAVTSRLHANWAVTDVAYDNVAYVPPPDTAFIRLVIDESSSKQITTGQTTACHRIVGLIHVAIFVPLKSGTRVARQYAGGVANIFRNAQFGTPIVTCRSPKIVRVGEVDGMYQLSVIVDFWCDVDLPNAA